MRRFSPLLLLPLAAVLWALGSELTAPGIADLQKAYAEEQNKIDLALAELALEATSGTTPGEVVQEKIDEWARANASRLREQAARATELDAAAPLAPMVRPDFTKDVSLSPDARRVAELDDLQERRIAELRAKADSPEHLQELLDEWAHGDEGKAILDERLTILSELSRANPLASQPVVLTLSENATPAEVATLAIHERITRRIQDLRSRNPNADGEEMQRLIDESKADFERDFDQIGDLMREVRHAEAIATVEKLRAAAASTEGAPLPAK